MVSRREFLKRSGWLAVGVALAACGGEPAEEPGTVAPTDTLRPTDAVKAAPTVGTEAGAVPTVGAVATRTVPPTAGQAYLAAVKGEDAAAITRAAVDALGGIERFVQRGDEVIVKPNMCAGSYPPEYAVTTNPIVVATLVEMCLDAGAKRVRVMDAPFASTAKQAYAMSGIGDAVGRAGGQMELMNAVKYAQFDIPNGLDLKNWKVYRDVLEADVLINVPIAKTHSSATLTLGMKNLMGVVQDRNGMHRNLHQRIADLATLVRPTLNVVDGYRVLAQNGPTGGRLEYVKQARTVIASHDIVAADAFAAQEFFQLAPEDVGYIGLGREMNVGRCDFDALDVKRVTL